MLPMLIGTVITGPIGGSLTDRYGTRLFATLGIDPASYRQACYPYLIHIFFSHQLLAFVYGMAQIFNLSLSNPGTRRSNFLIH